MNNIVLTYEINTIDTNETQSMEHVRYLRSPLSSMAEHQYRSMEHMRYLRSPLSNMDENQYELIA